MVDEKSAAKSSSSEAPQSLKKGTCQHSWILRLLRYQCQRQECVDARGAAKSAQQDADPEKGATTTSQRSYEEAKRNPSEKSDTACEGCSSSTTTAAVSDSSWKSCSSTEAGNGNRTSPSGDLYPSGGLTDYRDGLAVDPAVGSKEVVESQKEKKKAAWKNKRLCLGSSSRRTKPNATTSVVEPPPRLPSEWGPPPPRSRSRLHCTGCSRLRNCVLGGSRRRNWFDVSMRLIVWVVVAGALFIIIWFSVENYGSDAGGGNGNGAVVAAGGGGGSGGGAGGTTGTGGIGDGGGIEGDGDDGDDGDGDDGDGDDGGDDGGDGGGDGGGGGE